MPKGGLRPLCSVANCGKLNHGHGLCVDHWHRWRRHGDPLGGKRKAGAALRYLNEVALTCNTDACLIWPFARNPVSGHAIMRFEGRTQIVHRVVCTLIKGPPPAPHYECAHSCGRGGDGCVNPVHLRWATSKENSHDCLLHGTRPRGSRAGRAKLIESDIPKIRALLETGLSHNKIGKLFNVSAGAITAIAYRRSWDWL